MSEARLVRKRNNFFDGQQIRESNLDLEQEYYRTLTSDIALDFHGSGVLNKEPFSEWVLLDTSAPGSYGTNASKISIESGTFDGKMLNVDRQPRNVVDGTRLEVELKDSDALGREVVKVIIIGRVFDGTESSGRLEIDYLSFKDNGKQLSNYYFTSIIGVMFNNVSGCIGQSYYDSTSESLNLNGAVVIREASDLSVFAYTKSSLQVTSPNQFLASFVTSSLSTTIEEEISLGLDSSDNVEDLYIDLEGKAALKFEKDGEYTTSFGQKFLARSNNIQRVDLLLSVDEDNTQDAGEEFFYSGSIVVSIHELLTTANSNSDVVPEELIGFDPNPNPLAQVSFSQSQMEELGYKLSDVPSIVSFSFAGTYLSDPANSGILKDDAYYAIIISRSGSNAVGTINVHQGYDTKYKKEDLGIQLSLEEEFKKSESKFFQYDPVFLKYVDDSTASLWFIVHSAGIEVASGIAYSELGKCIVLPATESFVGGNKISYFKRNVPLATSVEGSINYVILSQVDGFVDPEVHSRTNNQVYTAIEDKADVTVISESDYAALDETPILLAKIDDNNVRAASTVSISIDKPGLINTDYVWIKDPSNPLLQRSLIGRIFAPDTDCSCTAKYRIIDTECVYFYAGDLDDDKSLTSADLSSLVGLVGNVINSSTTEASILSGDISYVDFWKSDLDDNGIINGQDISILEDAIDGYVNFVTPEKMKFLKLYLENITPDLDYGIIYNDGADTGATNAGNQITFDVDTEARSRAIRVGDIVTISASADAGTYVITSITRSGLSVTVEVTENGNIPTFTSLSSLPIVVTSASKVNLFADNSSLLTVPYVAKNSTISLIESLYDSVFISVCDIRRFTQSSFIEEKSEHDSCIVDGCGALIDCSPKLVNQTYIPGDLYLPNGSILTAPGVPHPGDYEYVNFTIPIPPGSIDDCGINIYTNFIKLDSNCKTAAGFPAMKFSDGTFVGAEDSSTETDLSRGRVKISTSIKSLYVDAFVDGYASDGYFPGDTSVTAEESEIVTENYENILYRTFSAWTENGFNDGAITDITHPAGDNEPAIFELTTIASSATKFGRLDSPVAAQAFTGDFVLDFDATRLTWPTISAGIISSFGTLVITNTDTVATLKLGWKKNGTSELKMFYSGVIEDLSSVVLDTFNYEITAPDEIGEVVKFRFRRTEDAVSAMYYIEDRIVESTEDSFGKFVQIGSNPDTQPGDGEADFSFEISQESTPTAALYFSTRLKKVEFKSEYSSEDNGVSPYTIGRNSGTKVNDRFTFTIPVNITNKTNISAAILKIMPAATVSVSDTYNVYPLQITNAGVLGPAYDVPDTTNDSVVTSFVPGALTSGTALEIDVTSLIISLINTSGHLPGLLKGLVIESEIDANSSFTITDDIELVISYDDATTGVIFKVGASIDSSTSILTLNTKNILYDALKQENRTVLNIDVHLKKAGFKNENRTLSISDLTRLGIGTCRDESVVGSDDECYFIVGSSATGTTVEGPFPCTTNLP